MYNGLKYQNAYYYYSWTLMDIDNYERYNILSLEQYKHNFFFTLSINVCAEKKTKYLHIFIVIIIQLQ